MSGEEALQDSDLGSIFTPEQPLGPIAINDEVDVKVLRALYDTNAGPHRQSQQNAPSFIVGRRGSGKTSLLLSRQLEPGSVIVHLSTDGTFSRVRAVVEQLRRKVLLTEEGVAEVWRLLLWGPISLRLLERRNDRDPQSAFMLLWEELAAVRSVLAADACNSRSKDDLVLDWLAQRLLETITWDNALLGADSLARHFAVQSSPWQDCISAGLQLIKARRAKVYVLIDSLENVGQQISELELTLKGLFHLVGKMGMNSSQRGFQLQCCFPSELWPILDTISANPLKDFAGRMVLQWHGDDLIKAAALRLRAFLDSRFPNFDPSAGDGARLISALFPESVTNRLGEREPAISYMLRHTQLLPRQFFYILNEAVHRAIVATGQPIVREADIVDAVGEVEATLCPEIFAAHRFRYPEAHDVARRLIPYLPFRFSDGYLHEKANQAAIQKSFGLDYRELREMLVHVGILGRFQRDEDYYIRAEFEYTVEGSLNLSPDEDYCLHPLFVRQYSSRDVVHPPKDRRPVYPAGTPA